MVDQTEFDFLEGERLRDHGIQVAVDHADNVYSNWSERAFAMFEKWLSGWPYGYTFLMEDFRLASTIHGLPTPPSKRAFGSVAVKAKSMGLIKAIGTQRVKNKKAHLCYASVWMKI